MYCTINHTPLLSCTSNRRERGEYKHIFFFILPQHSMLCRDVSPKLIINSQGIFLFDVALCIVREMEFRRAQSLAEKKASYSQTGSAN